MSRRRLASLVAAAIAALGTFAYAASPGWAASPAAVGDSGLFTFISAATSAYETLSVNVANGNLLVRDSDGAQAKGTASHLTLDRYYNSEASANPGAEAAGNWSYSAGIEVNLSVSGTTVTAYMPSGASAVFTQNPDGSYTSATTTAELSLSNGVYTLVDPFGNTETFNPVAGSSTDYYESSQQGKSDAAPTSVYDNTSSDQSVSYLSNLSNTTDGTSLTINHPDYSLCGCNTPPAQSINDSSGGTATYGYNGDELTSFTSYTAAQTSYGYTSSGLLNSITEPDGTQASISYNSAGEVASLAMTKPSDSDYAPITYTFTYGSGVTTVATDSSGNATQYTYDANGIVTDVSQVGPDNDATSNFAADVETMGETSYADTFAGAALTDDGTVVVSSNSQTDSQLRAAIASADTGNVPVQYTQASLSYNQLDNLSSTVSGAAAQLAANGIEVVSVGSNPQTDTARATLLTPSADDLAKLGSNPSVQAQYGTVTTANYAQAASYLLNQDYGPGISVDPVYATSSVTSAAGAFSDHAPWSGGDYLTNQWAQCSGGFMVKGNASGNIFMLTAGHCGTGTFAQGAFSSTVGSTSSRYIFNAQHDDFQTIRVSGDSGKPYVWLAGYDKPVSGENIPAAGRGRATTAGTITGPKYGNRVLSNNLYLPEVCCDAQTKDAYPAAHLIELASYAGSTICQKGDSGGPVLLRMPSGRTVKAVGTIVGWYGLKSGGEVCVAERISSEEARSNTSLLLYSGAP